MKHVSYGRLTGISRVPRQDLLRPGRQARSATRLNIKQMHHCQLRLICRKLYGLSESVLSEGRQT
jgi:hypothetical protein